MNKLPRAELALSLVVMGLLVLSLNPFHEWWMPPMAALTISCVITITFLFFAVFFWKERAQDEREEHHRHLAGRLAFLVGSAILVLGIVVETWRMHAVNPWLLLALAGMVLAKIFARFYYQETQ